MYTDDTDCHDNEDEGAHIKYLNLIRGTIFGNKHPWFNEGNIEIVYNLCLVFEEIVAMKPKKWLAKQKIGRDASEFLVNIIHEIYTIHGDKINDITEKLFGDVASSLLLLSQKSINFNHSCVAKEPFLDYCNHMITNNWKLNYSGTDDAYHYFKSTMHTFRRINYMYHILPDLVEDGFKPIDYHNFVLPWYLRDEIINIDGAIGEVGGNASDPELMILSALIYTICASGYDNIESYWQDTVATRHMYDDDRYMTWLVFSEQQIQQLTLPEPYTKYDYLLHAILALSSAIALENKHWDIYQTLDIFDEILLGLTPDNSEEVIISEIQRRVTQRLSEIKPGAEQLIEDIRDRPTI